MTENPRTNVQLADFQARFVKQFLQPGAAAHQLLSGSVGAGKTFAAAAIASRVMASEEPRRVLVLCPAALTYGWREALCAFGDIGEVAVIDRRLFRELQSRVPVGESPWPSWIIVISDDTAKSRDITSSLAEACWDLVIYDEAHRIAGRRRELMENLIQTGSVGRLLLLVVRPEPERYFDLVPDLRVTDWTPELDKWRRGHAATAAVVREPPIVYSRTKDEIAFLEPLKEAAGKLSRSPQGRLLSQILLHGASSSIFTVEQALLRALRRLEMKDGQAGLSTEAELKMAPGVETQSDWSEEEPPSSPWAAVPDALSLVAKLVDLAAAVEHDVKFGALETLLEDLAAGGEGVHACVFTDFAATVDYLSMNLSEGDSGCFAVTGVMPADHRIQQIREFEERGGVLIGTTAALQGVALAFAETVVHYDLPRNQSVIDQRLGRVDRVGRTHRCCMYVFRDDSGVLAHEDELLRLHGWTQIQGGAR